MSATQTIGFKRHFRAEIREGLGAFLFSERGVTTLRGEHVAALAALLDGSRDLSTIQAERPGGLPPSAVADMVERLETAGLVTSRYSRESISSPQASAYFDACGLEFPPRTEQALIGIGGLGPSVDAAAVATAVAGESLSTTVLLDPSRPSPGSGLSVVLCEDYLDPDLSRVDDRHREAGVPWLLAKPVGTQLWLGPFFGAPGAACWQCLATRLWGHRQAEACVQDLLGHVGPAPRSLPSLPSLSAMAAHLIAAEVTKWWAGHRRRGQRGVWTLDTVTLDGVHHELRRRPQCRVCGDPSLVTAAVRRPVTLPPTPIAGGSATGGRRAVAPETVLDTYRHLISPVTGVVKEIARDEAAPPFAHAYLSGPNPAVTVRGLDRLGATFRQFSGGKGITAVDAEVGALCEALERYCGAFTGDEEQVSGSLRSLGDDAIHPHECLLFHERQYASRTEWNRRHGPFQQVFTPLDADAVLPWTPVYSLTERRHRLLPTALLYYGAGDGGTGAVKADSNGNAAGSSLADAVLQGLYEVIERDAVALWWYNRTTAPAVDLDDFAEPGIDALRQGCAELGRALWVLDVTADIDVPVMVAVSADSRRMDDVTFGFGAHRDPRVAIRRALAEQNQLLPVVTSRQQRDFGDQDAAWWFTHATVHNQPYLAADPAQPRRRRRDYDQQSHDDIADEVHGLVALLAERGLDTLVLDQTRPDIELPVVKVVVPGLRHYWARLGPGRLYDVPVATGKLAAPTAYADLNPIPMFM